MIDESLPLGFESSTRPTALVSTTDVKQWLASGQVVALSASDTDRVALDSRTIAEIGNVHGG